MNKIISVERAHGPLTEGSVLVMREGFSPRYDLDRISGIISRVGHSAEGESIQNKILVIPTVKGGVAGGWAFYDLMYKNISPKALVLGKINPVMVQGGVLAGLAVTQGWSEDLIAILKNGDQVRINPEKKQIEIFHNKFSISLDRDTLESCPFHYVRPDSIQSVFELLNHYGDSAKILAGGQSLLPSLNMRLSAPEVLIDISQLNELKQIKEINNELHVGSLVRHCEIEQSNLIARYAPLLHKALPYVAHKSVRSRGTFGGSIAFADAASETPAMVLAHDASLIVRSSTGQRKIAATDFFLGLYETALQPQEILIGAEFQKPVVGERYVFREIARRKGDYATVGIGIRASIQSGFCSEMKIVFSL